MTYLIHSYCNYSSFLIWCIYSRLFFYYYILYWSVVDLVLVLGIQENDSVMKIYIVQNILQYGKILNLIPYTLQYVFVGYPFYMFSSVQFAKS